MLNDEEVGLLAAEDFLYIAEPFIGEVSVNSVEHGDLLVLDDVGVISHTVGNVVLSLEKVELVIVHADVENVVSNIIHW